MTPLKRKIDLPTYQKEKQQVRSCYWQNLFNKYTQHEDEEAELSVDDIVEVYGKSRISINPVNEKNVDVSGFEKSRARKSTLIIKKTATSNRKSNPKLSASSSKKKQQTKRAEENVRKSKRLSQLSIDNSINNVNAGISGTNNKKSSKKDSQNLRSSTDTVANVSASESTVAEAETIEKKLAVKTAQDMNTTEVNTIQRAKRVRRKAITCHCCLKTEIKLEVPDEPDTEFMAINDGSAKNITQTLNVDETNNIKQEIDEPITYSVRMRSRSRLKNNTMINNDSVNNDGANESTVNNSNMSNMVDESLLRRGRSRFKNITSDLSINTSINEYNLEVTKMEKDTEDIPEFVPNVVALRRGRSKNNLSTLNNSIKTRQQYKKENILDQTKHKSSSASNKKTRNTKQKSPTNLQKYIVHASCKKELQKMYPELISDEKLSKSFTGIPNVNKNLTARRSRSCVNLSDRALKPIPCPTSSTERKGRTNKKEKLPTLGQRKSLRLQNSSKLSNHHEVDDTKENDVENQSSKKQTSMSVFGNIFFNTSQCSTTVSESDILDAKLIIEQKCKSNIGLLMIRRYYSLKLTVQDKEDIFCYWHNEVKKELIKLHKVISMEKLAQYIKWYMAAWFAKYQNQFSLC